MEFICAPVTSFRRVKRGYVHTRKEREKKNKNVRVSACADNTKGLRTLYMPLTLAFFRGTPPPQKKIYRRKGEGERGEGSSVQVRDIYTFGAGGWKYFISVLFVGIAVT